MDWVDKLVLLVWLCFTALLVVVALLDGKTTEVVVAVLIVMLFVCLIYA